MLAILLSGLLAYRMLPLSALPEVDYPTIQVVTLYPRCQPGCDHVHHHCPPGTTVRADAGAEPDVVHQFGRRIRDHAAIQSVVEPGCRAEQQVQAAINAGNNFLPTDLPTPPIYSKVNPADTPILTVALSSKSLPLTTVEDLADTRLAQKISQLSGVGLVTISGGQRPAVRIQANPKALAAYGITLEDLRTSITNANLTEAKGSFDGPSRASTIDANDQVRTPEEYQRLVVAYRNGAPIRLSDVATVISAAENIRLAAWANREPAVILNIQRQPGANVIEVADRVKALLPAIAGFHSGAVDVTLLTRPHYHHPCFGQGCAIRVAAIGGAGGDGDLPVPAQHPGHHHPQFCRAAVVSGYFWRDVPDGFQHQQPLP